MKLHLCDSHNAAASILPPLFNMSATSILLFPQDTRGWETVTGHQASSLNWYLKLGLLTLSRPLQMQMMERNGTTNKQSLLSHAASLCTLPYLGISPMEHSGT